MSVYVDNPQHQYGRMKMCHMLADTSEELHAMAAKLGLDRDWLQHAGTYREHYDVCKAKRRLAIQYGAIPVTTRTIGALLMGKRAPAAHPHHEDR